MPYKDPKDKRARDKAYHAKNRDRIRAVRKVWENKNRLKRREYARLYGVSYREKNRERINSRKRQWEKLRRRTDPENVRALARAAYRRRRNAVREMQRLYRLLHKGKYMERERAYYSRTREARRIAAAKRRENPDVRAAGKAFCKARAQLLKTCPHCGGEVSLSAWKLKLLLEKEMEDVGPTKAPRKRKAGKPGKPKSRRGSDSKSGKKRR